MQYEESAKKLKMECGKIRR